MGFHLRFHFHYGGRLEFWNAHYVCKRHVYVPYECMYGIEDIVRKEWLGSLVLVLALLLYATSIHFHKYIHTHLISPITYTYKDHIRPNE